MKPLYDAADRYLDLSVRRPWLLLALYTAVTLLLGWQASRLGLSTSLSNLLPEDTPSVRAVREASTRVGSTDHLIIAIEAPTVELGTRAVDLVSERMRATMPDLAEVLGRVDLAFFEKNALMYLTPDELSRIDAQLKKVVGRLKLDAMGLIDLPDPDPEVERLRRMVRSALERAVRRTVPVTRSRGPAQGRRVHIPKGYLASPDGRVFAVVARPKGRSVDMAYARSLVARAEAAIAWTMDRLGHPEGLRMEVGGGFRNRVREYDSIRRDAFGSFGLSFLLMALIVALYFRSWKPIVAVFPPLVLAIVWTLGLARLAGLERLNLITAFIGAILLGMGIDYGVHLTARFVEERAGTEDLLEALRKSVFPTARALMTAALTTSAALFLLYLSSFRGFWEFGLLAGSGILVTLVAYLLVFPPVAVVLGVGGSRHGRRYRDVLPSRRMSWALLGAALLVVVVGAALWVPRLGIETNMRALSGHPSTSIRYGRAVGDTASPTVVLCQDREGCSTLTGALEERFFTDLPDPDIKGFLSPYLFVPQDQPERLERIASIRRRLRKALKWAEGDTKKTIRDLLSRLPERPFSFSDLPGWVRGRFTEKDGSWGRFVYVYPARDTWDVGQARAFKESFDPSRMGARGAAVASSSFILVDVLDAAVGDGVRIFLWALLLVLVVVLVDLRSVRGALVVFGTLVAGLVMGAASMPWLGQKIGIYNMVVLSSVVGTGIDGAVHLYHALTEDGVPFSRALFRTAPAVAVASVTTMAGFAMLMFTHHGGLASIGRLAVLGIGATLVASLAIVPPAVRLFVRKS